MANNSRSGFELRQLFNVKNLPRYVSAITRVDYDVDDIIDQNRLSKSKTKGGNDSDDVYGYLYDGISAEYENIPYFSRDYNARKKDLYNLCSHPEIEFIIHSVGYDAVSYDEKNFFLEPQFDSTLKPDMVNQLTRRFKQIYQSLGFNDGFFAWEKFVEFLKIGYLAMEIVYDNPYNPKEIIGFEELMPEELVPFHKDIEVINNGVISKKRTKLWKEITVNGSQKTERILPDNSVIFISYSKIAGNGSKLAYSERLIRSFNLKRTIENCKVAWQVMNSQFRLKIVLPVGTRNSDKAKQALAAVNNKYKEDVTIDTFSGEVYMNGQPLINFGKTIALPSRSGQTPEISSISFEGPNLEDMDIVKHFERNLWRDSNMPYSRFDKDNGGGTTILFSDDGISNDDRFYYSFINTIRKEYEQIIKKPLYIQSVMDYPQLKKDKLFKTKFGLKYNSDSLYQQAKEEQMEDHKIERIQKMMELTDNNADGAPIFDLQFLVVNKYGLLSQEEWNAATQKPKPPGDGGDEGGGGNNEIVDELPAPPNGEGGPADTPVEEPGTDEFTPQ